MIPGPARETLLTGGFVVLWLVAFLQEMSFALLVHLPGYLSRLGATESRIGLVFGVAALVGLLLRPAMGRVIDQAGRRRVVHVAGAVMTISILAYVPLTSFGLPVFFVHAAFTTSEVLVFTTVLALAADIVPESRRAQGLAVLGISGLVPIGLGSVMGDAVLAGRSFTALFVVAAAMSAAAWGFAWGLPRLPSLDPERRRHRGFVRVLRQRDLGPVWLVSLVFAAAMAILFTFLRTYVDASGVGSVGLYLGVYAAAAVAVRLLATSRLDRVGTSVILVPSTLALALQFVVLAAVPSETGMIVAGAIGGVGHGLMFPLLSTMVVDRATAEERGTALAVFSGVFDAVVLFGAPALGVLIEVTGYAASFLAVAATIVAGIVGFLIWERALETPVSDPPRSG